MASWACIVGKKSGESTTKVEKPEEPSTTPICVNKLIGKSQETTKSNVRTDETELSACKITAENSHQYSMVESAQNIEKKYKEAVQKHIGLNSGTVTISAEDVDPSELEQFTEIKKGRKEKKKVPPRVRPRVIDRPRSQIILENRAVRVNNGPAIIEPEKEVPRNYVPAPVPSVNIWEKRKSIDDIEDKPIATHPAEMRGELHGKWLFRHQGFPPPVDKNAHIS